MTSRRASSGQGPLRSRPPGSTLRKPGPPQHGQRLPKAKPQIGCRGMRPAESEFGCRITAPAKRWLDQGLQRKRPGRGAAEPHARTEGGFIRSAIGVADRSGVHPGCCRRGDDRQFGCQPVFDESADIGLAIRWRRDSLAVLIERPAGVDRADICDDLSLAFGCHEAAGSRRRGCEPKRGCRHERRKQETKTPHATPRGAVATGSAPKQASAGRSRAINLFAVAFHPLVSFRKHALLRNDSAAAAGRYDALAIGSGTASGKVG